jgi:metal-dependent amidase/aminoacylase/carboxypeptidase family protein
VRGYPATINDPEATASPPPSRGRSWGRGKVDGNAGREMGAEDFAYMLQERPGAYLFLGAGPGAGLHHPEFDFNDAIAPIGASIFARLVETAQPAA